MTADPCQDGGIVATQHDRMQGTCRRGNDLRHNRRKTRAAEAKARADAAMAAAARVSNTANALASASHIFSGLSGSQSEAAARALSEVEKILEQLLRFDSSTSL